MTSTDLIELNPSLCAKCSQIDLGRFLNPASYADNTSKEAYSYSLFDLDHLTAASQCELCRFFLQLRDWSRDGSNKGFKLHAFLTSQVFDVWHHKALEESVFLGILSQSWKHENEEDKSVRSCSLYFAEAVDNPSRISARVVTPSVNYPLLRSWLDFCECYHSCNCGQPRSGSLPSELPRLRLIDCETRTLKAAEDLLPTMQYVTLSYVWGAPGSETVDPDADRLPDALPLVVDDAMQVTIGLGFRYLWVDRYCISQADSVERANQIGKMNIVYAHSAVTIIATAGDDASYGLPGVSARPRLPQPRVTVGSRTLVSTLLNVKQEILGSVWNTRGWTFQEGMLARRRLVFTEHQAYFQCNTMWCQESISAPLHVLHEDDYSEFAQLGLRPSDTLVRGLPRAFNPREAHLNPSWWELLQSRLNQYSVRNFTFEGDALSAFRGVLDALGPRRGERGDDDDHEGRESGPMPFFCGLPLGKSDDCPKGDIVSSLTWRFWGEMGNLRRRSAFPSWAWVGYKTASEVTRRSGRHGFEFDRNALQYGRFRASAEAQVAFSDGEFLLWRGHEDVIIRKESMGVVPRHLRLTGIMFPIQWRGDGLFTAGLNLCTRSATDCYRLNDMDCVDTINRARDLLGTERSEAEFVGLVLGGLIRNMRRGRGEMYYIWVLLLHALPGGDCLERVDVLLLRKYQGAGWDDIFDIPHSYEQTVRVG